MALPHVPNLKHREWYHQRFDGSPMYLGFIAEAAMWRDARTPQGTEANVGVCFFEAGTADWYFDMADIRRGSQMMVNLAKKDTNISKKLLAAWKNDEDKFQQLFNGFHRLNLQAMADLQLLVLYQKYYTLAVKRFTSSAIIDHFALGTDHYIADMLRKEIGKVGKESEFSTVFSVATAPVHQSFINKAEMD
mgnify:CR=1 FL=1